MIPDWSYLRSTAPPEFCRHGMRGPERAVNKRSASWLLNYAESKLRSGRPIRMRDRRGISGASQRGRVCEGSTALFSRSQEAAGSGTIPYFISQS